MFVCIKRFAPKVDSGVPTLERFLKKQQSERPTTSSFVCAKSVAFKRKQRKIHFNVSSSWMQGSIAGTSSLPNPLRTQIPAWIDSTKTWQTCQSDHRQAITYGPVLSFRVLYDTTNGWIFLLRLNFCGKIWKYLKNCPSSEKLLLHLQPQVFFSRIGYFFCHFWIGLANPCTLKLQTFWFNLFQSKLLDVQGQRIVTFE